jgi:hypothetical protein
VTRRLAIAAVAAVAVPLLAADGAMACSCAAPKGGITTRSIHAADGVFVGRLVAVRPVARSGQDTEPEDQFGPADFVYRVGRVYNGGPGLRRGRRVKVRSNRSQAACGLPQGRGRLYGLFVERRPGRWRGGLCGVVDPDELRNAEDGSAAGSGGACR